MIALWVNWLAVALLLGYVRLVERERWASLLLTRPSRADLEYALLAWGVVMAWSWVVRTVLPQPPDQGTSTITALPVLAVAALVVTTAVTEEILFRAYPIERIGALTGYRAVGVAVSAAVFVAPHLVFFGPQWLLYHGMGAVAAYVLHLRRRNLPACMLLHLLVNAPILIPTVLSS